MANLIKISFFLLFAGLFHNSSATINELEKKLVRKAMKTMTKLPSILGQAFELYEMFENVSGMLTQEDGPLDTDDRLDMIIDKLNQLSSDMEAFEGRLNHKIEYMHTSDKLDTALKDLSERFDKIDNYYTKFVDFLNDTLIFREDQIKEFAETTTKSNEHGVSDILSTMHNSFIRGTGTTKNIPTLLLDGGITQEFVCAMQQSPQQIIHTLYQQILLSEVKGYAMLTFSHEVLDAIANEMKKTSNEEQARNSFKKRMGKTFKVVRGTMKYASREVWICDPKNPVENRDYARFGPVFQRYAIYEKDAQHIQTKRRYDDCSSSCPQLNHVEHKCKTNNLCNGAFCNGNIRDCERKGSSLSYCYANDAYRRYQYFEIDGKLYGNKTCEDYNHVTTSGESWDVPSILKFEYLKCSYCICTCEDIAKSLDKYVSLRPVYSDYDHNKVVTGARAKLINSIFYIQIQQGTLLENGRIDPMTIGWKNVSDFSIWDEGIREGEDYYEISWESKTICLDDVDSKSSPYKKNHVLTGLQFQKVGDQLQLSVHLSKFNPHTGVVAKDERNPKLHFLEPDNRSMFSLDNLDVPNKYENPKPRPVGNQCFELTTSDLEKDAGQNVLPFIDIRPIVTSPPSPLSGAGLFLRSDDADKSGGYLALKLFTMNLEQFMKLPTAEENLGTQ